MACSVARSAEETEQAILAQYDPSENSIINQFHHRQKKENLAKFILSRPPPQNLTILLGHYTGLDLSPLPSFALLETVKTIVILIFGLLFAGFLLWLAFLNFGKEKYPTSTLLAVLAVVAFCFCLPAFQS